MCSNLNRFDINALILDLSKIDRILKNTDPTEKERFLSNFNKWAEQRRNTLSELKKLKTELNDICFKADIGKCLGKGASVVGGLAALVGLGLQLSSDAETRSTGKKIASFGVGVGLLGAGASATSSGVENVVNKRILDKVKSSLERDQLLTKHLVPYLVKSADLNALFRQVFDCDMYSDTLTDIFTVVRGAVSLFRQGKYAYEEISEAFSSTLNECSNSFELEGINRIFQRLSKKAQFVLQEFCENRQVRDAVLKLEKFITSSSLNLDITEVTGRVFFRMFAISKEPGYVSLIAQIGSAAKVANILLRTVSLAMDIVVFIALTKDIMDSESKYSEMVGKIEFFLSKELSEANRLVNQFNRNQF